MASTPGFLSVRDPENFAISAAGEWFRIASPESAHALRRLVESDVYGEFTKSGNLVEFTELSRADAEPIIDLAEVEAARSVDQGAAVFAVQSVPEITYPWEWPNALLAAAGRLTLDFREALLDIGLDLKDASAFNVQFFDGKPIILDVGSVEIWRPNPSWNAGKQFIEHFINPLAVGYSGAVSASDAWSMTRGRGVPSGVARQLMPRSLRRRLGLAILQASTRPVGKNAPSEVRYRDLAVEDRKLALRATRSFTSRLRKNLEKLESEVHRTTWAEYGNRDHYSATDLDQKSQLSLNFIRKLNLVDEALILDVGGNDGMTAIAATAHSGCRCIVLDMDTGALDQLAARITSLDEAPRITPLVGDITNLTPASGLLHREFSELQSRVRPDALFCQAVLHHVVITQGVPMPLAVAALAEFGAPLQIEFADLSDEKVKLLIGQIPNWSGDYSIDSLITSLETHFERVEVIGRTSATRVVVEALGPRLQEDL